MNNFNIMHAKVLYLRFCAIYDHKFVKSHHDEDFKSLWATEWSSGLSEIDPNSVKDALEHCKKNLEWPPSIAEFIRICDSFSGIPGLEESMNLASSRDFTHPVVLMAYERVGSWAMKNDSVKELKPKFQAAYLEAINKFRSEKENGWQKLESFNQKPKELPAPPKIPTNTERKGFKGRMAEYQKRIDELKLACAGKPYKEFDERAIDPNNHYFDKKVYEEYRDYLLSIPEIDVLILPPTYAYARSRFIGQQEKVATMRESGANPNPQGRNCDSTRHSNGPKKVYKSWSGD